jgi:hypothetical protein
VVIIAYTILYSLGQLVLYSQRKMTDFYVHGAVMLGFWLTSAIFAYVFIYLLVKFGKDMVEIY